MILSRRINTDSAMQHELSRARITEGAYSMFPTLKTIAATGAILLGVAAPALAQDASINLGPVGPRDPILASLGGQRVIAFFVPERGSCAVNVIIWKDAKADAPYASSRVKVSLRPGEMVQFDETKRSMNLLCGADASTLSVVAPAELIFTGSPPRN
jgi:hypothetical protein